MSLECPNGHGRQDVVYNITKDGLPARKAEDVLARRLRCNCVVGGEEYNEFLMNIQKIDEEEKAAFQALKRKTQEKKSKAYTAFAQKGAQ